MKFTHPILSCDAVMSWITIGSLAAQLRQVIWALPSTYVVTTALMLGCVAFAAIHEATLARDCWKALERPFSGHHAMWQHVSLYNRQLGHLGSWLSWCERNFKVPAMPSWCFDAHNWNNHGTKWREACTNSHPTFLNPLPDRTCFHRKSAFASWRCAWKGICWPAPDNNFAPLIKIPMGSRGNK